jgi:2'-5' RNA ligase
VKWVRTSGIHLTLKFLGDTQEHKIIQIQHVMDEISHGKGAFPISIQGVGCFPNCKSPRVIWVGVKETQGNLQDLQLRLENGLTKLNFPREKRKYHPHLTIGRVRRHVGTADRREIGEKLNHIEQTDIETQSIYKISLIRSDLKPSGAVYTHLYSSSLNHENLDLEK